MTMYWYNRIVGKKKLWLIKQSSSVFTKAWRERERDCSQAYMEYALVHSPCECEELHQWNLAGNCMLDTRPWPMFCLQYVFCSGLVGRDPSLPFLNENNYTNELFYLWLLVCLFLGWNKNMLVLLFLICWIFETPKNLTILLIISVLLLRLGRSRLSM